MMSLVALRETLQKLEEDFHPTRLVLDIAHPLDSVPRSNHACCSCVENECSHRCFGIVSKNDETSVRPPRGPTKERHARCAIVGVEGTQ